MSNYPPGVTGFEPQIAGAAETDGYHEVSECPNLGEFVTTRISPTRVSAVMCAFAGGEVPGVFTGDHALVTFWWECPSCGAEHDLADLDAEDLFGDDPDREREEW